VTRRVETAPTFERELKRLAKRYPNIRRDLEPLIKALIAGDTPGDRLKGLRHVAYKVRIKNSDAQRGKSGGYRTIYYLPEAERIVLLTMYSKSAQPDIPNAEIARIITDELNG
jgi:mRNA-degrading endonuclease RelE of RelBE toxin-antitoxin system